jgi:glycosyltransferase involved in cell wall biosynthesis
MESPSSALAKILLLAHKFWPSQGGTQRLVHDLGVRLVRRGHQVTVFTSAVRSTEPDEWIDGLHVRRFKKRSILVRPWYVTPSMVLEPVWTEFEILHSFHFVTFQSLFAAVLRRAMNVPFVLTPSYHPWRGLYEETLGTITMRSADMVIAQCRQERRRLLRYLDPQRIVDIPCGIESSTFRHLPDSQSFRRKYGIAETDRVILYVGSIDKRFVGELVDSMPRILERVPAAKLILIGGTSSRGAMLDRTSRVALLNSVKMLGNVDQHDLLEAYSLADVFAFPSEHESFGIVLLEAAAAGVPIVSTRVGVAEELVFDGSNGFIVDFSPREFADRIVQVLSSETIRENARRNRTRLLGPYDWDRITDSIESVYRGCMA